MAGFLFGIVQDYTEWPRIWGTFEVFLFNLILLFLFIYWQNYMHQKQAMVLFLVVFSENMPRANFGMCFFPESPSKSDY